MTQRAVVRSIDRPRWLRIVAGNLAAVLVGGPLWAVAATPAAPSRTPLPASVQLASCPCEPTPPCPPGRPYIIESHPGSSGLTPTPMEGEDQFPPDKTEQGDGTDAPETDLNLQGDSGSNLPSGLGAVAAAQSPSMHMIGDYFGGGYFLGDGLSGGFASVSSAGGDRRFKATDNLNPLPQDRVFFNYHHFENAVYDINGAATNIDRFTLGYERTFLDDTVSIEIRMPITSGLNPSQVSSFDPSVSPDLVSTEFGNLTFTIKTFVCEIGCWKVLSGLAISLPTAEDAFVYDNSTATMLENEAVHLQPYVGLHYSHPCDRLFTTVYGAIDFDTNGNQLSTGFIDSDGLELFPVANVKDQQLLFIDWQVGYWWYRDYGHAGYLNGIAPVLELHYSKALEEPVQGLGVMNNPFGEVELLNLTGGLVFDFRRKASLTVYGAAPLIQEEAVLFGQTVSPVFDAEFGVQLVYRY